MPASTTTTGTGSARGSMLPEHPITGTRCQRRRPWPTNERGLRRSAGLKTQEEPGVSRSREAGLAAGPPPSFRPVRRSRRIRPQTHPGEGPTPTGKPPNAMPSVTRISQFAESG